MDVYSFGMILWELWHESVPFDNDINQAIQYVVKEESRPKIMQQDSPNASDEEEENKEEEPDSLTTFCDNIISTLIRKCWSQDPNERPKFMEICHVLTNKIQMDQT